MRFSTKITNVKSLIEGENDNSLKIINVNLNYKNPFSVSKKNATKNLSIKPLTLHIKFH